MIRSTAQHATAAELAEEHHHAVLASARARAEYLRALRYEVRIEEALRLARERGSGRDHA